MRESWVHKEAYHFPGLTVIVPEQNRQQIWIMPVDLSDRFPVEVPEFTGNFELIRVIANIALFRVDDVERGAFEEPILEFDPPIEFYISYSLEDLRQAYCEIKRLKLAYWDLEKWVIISEPAYEYQILPLSTGPIAVVKIWDWLGDPPLAWGK